jgi:hypothetical protein
MVDIKNTELYLKVIAQIHSVYRTEGCKMLFGRGGVQPASSSGSVQPSGMHHQPSR